ncbi:hypothetical protein BSL78_29241 [Apostichopus japonicus]|uniref:Uncharacterized protein n=1 Tax=Stichopus japonicus TaxID=307972 RepID=A0A2G8JDX8_STIJA|nr:hypothetical protein BSL78_29241 [Apostichopus japonicus]
MRWTRISWAHPVSIPPAPSGAGDGPDGREDEYGHRPVKTQLIAHDKEVIILDVRVPCTPVARLNNHRACVNGIAWAPHSSCHICTAADDHQALIWDIQQMPRAIEDPILAYTAEGEINQIQWASTQPDWIAICYNNCLEILRV